MSMLLRAASFLALLVGLVLGVVATDAAAAEVRVAEGDTLTALAARHGTTVQALTAANGLSDANLIRVGQSLRLPGSPTQKAAHGTASYTVRPGDTLGGIAARHGVPLAAVVAANAIADANVIVIGARLRIPGRGVAPVRPAAPAASVSRRHRVRAGESLGRIARRYGTTTAALAKANGIVNPDLIVVGQRLEVPARGAPASALPEATSTAIRTVLQAPPPAVPKSQVRRLLNRYSARHGVDAGLTRAIAWQESGFQQAVISGAGAVGVMQLMPETAQWIGRDLLGRPINPRDVNDNIEGGVVFLKWLSRRAANRKQAIAGYYQGLRSVQTRGPYEDTRRYVRSVVALTGTV
jgi:LysM repeat protein